MYLTQGLHRSVQQHPDAIASICNGRVKTHREVLDRISRLAGALHVLGLRPDDRVGCHALNSDRFSEVYLATFWADGVINPINTRWSGREINYSIDDSGTTFLFADESLIPKLDEVLAHPGCPDVKIWMGDKPSPAGFTAYEDLIASTEPIADCRRGGDALAGLFYTGGTTGFPKGVMLTHRNIISSALGSMATGFMTRRPNLLHVAPMFHLAAFSSWVVTSLSGGLQVYLPKFIPAEALAVIDQYAITDTVLIPTMIQALLDDPESSNFEVKSLRRIIYGGSSITVDLLERARQQLPAVGFCQAYGQTELGPIATLLLPEDHDASESNPTLLRSGGRAARHTEVEIMSEAGEILPSGAIGEIVCRGPNMMKGYWNKPQETAAALPGDGWLHTGDAGYLDDAGYVYVVDRIKDMIISGGENVYSAEVENAVCDHAAVSACAVVGASDDYWGERVHAFVVPHPGTSIEADELRKYVRGLIADYKCPRSFTFVESLPVSSTGKVDKRALRQQLAA